MIREYRLLPRGRGISCDADGAFIASIPLLKRTQRGGKDVWVPRESEALSAALSAAYGLPIDTSSKARGLSAVADALNRGEIARAQMTTLFLKLPEPPPLAKHAPRDEKIAFIRELFWSGLLKARWNVRWPAGDPNRWGGRFAPGNADVGEPGIGHNGGPPLKPEEAAPVEETLATTLAPLAALTGAALLATTSPAGSAAEDEAIEKIHMHHPWPKYLGGAEQQNLTPLLRTMHIEYHAGLISEVARTSAGTSYYSNLSPEAKDDLFRRLMEFTKKFDAKHGTSLLDDMLRNGFPVPK